MRKVLDILGITDMAAGLKNVRTITLTAILIALTIIGNRLLIIPVMPGMLEIRFGFIFLATIAFLFGPVAAFFAGFTTNMLGFLLFSGTGGFNPLFDLNIGLSGVLYAVFLYRRNPKSEYFIIWILAARASVNFICHIIINTHLLIMFGFIPQGTAGVITTVRVFRNIALLPVEIIVMMIIVKFVADYANKYKFVNFDTRKKLRDGQAYDKS